MTAAPAPRGSLGEGAFPVAGESTGSVWAGRTAGGRVADRIRRNGGLSGARTARRLPQLEDGQVLDIANIIRATGYRPGYS